MKPGIAAEDLVCAFPCKSYGVFFPHKGAEIEEGRVYIGHIGKVVGLYGSIEPVSLSGRCTLQKMMVAVQIRRHFFHIRAVKGRLERIGSEILVVVLKVKGVGGKTFSSFFQFPGAYGGNNAGIYAAGKEGTDRYVCFDLAYHSVLNEKSSFFHSSFQVVLMGTAF